MCCSINTHLFPLRLLRRLPMPVLPSPPCSPLSLPAPLGSSVHAPALISLYLFIFYCFLTHSHFPSITSTSSLSPSPCATSPPFVDTPLFVDTLPLLTPHTLCQPLITASSGCVNAPATPICLCHSDKLHLWDGER